jgi:hypothetical protein
MRGAMTRAEGAEEFASEHRPDYDRGSDRLGRLIRKGDTLIHGSSSDAHSQFERDILCLEAWRCSPSKKR